MKKPVKPVKTFEAYNKLNEDVYEVNNAMELVKNLDARDMEVFMGELSNYFKRASKIVTNMDAKGISADLSKAHKKIKNRTGN